MLKKKLDSAQRQIGLEDPYRFRLHEILRVDPNVDIHIDVHIHCVHVVVVVDVVSLRGSLQCGDLHA